MTDFLSLLLRLLMFAGLFGFGRLIVHSPPRLPHHRTGEPAAARLPAGGTTQIPPHALRFRHDRLRPPARPQHQRLAVPHLAALPSARTHPVLPRNHPSAAGRAVRQHRHTHCRRDGLVIPKDAAAALMAGGRPPGDTRLISRHHSCGGSRNTPVRARWT